MFFSGCCPVQINDYAARGPKLDLRQYFDGPLEAEGAFFGRSGRIEKQFHIALRGSWQGNDGLLHEDFTYADGSKSQRLWKIAFRDDSHFTGTSDDVVGAATGRQLGNASHMKYALRLPVRGKTQDISMDDWLYRLSDTVVINRVAMRKFGFRAGELVIAFRKT